MANRSLTEESGIFYMNKNIVYPKNELLDDIEKIKMQKEHEEANKILLEAAKNKQAELDKKAETLECIPLGRKVILMPYPTNPYKKIMQGSIIVEYDGDFLNPDSGEKDKLKELVSCAKVIEVGPECKYVKPGDDVFYDSRTCYPLPLFSLGYLLTDETQILSMLNEGLKERFNMK